MARSEVAAERWSELDGLRQGFLTRCEKYSQLTIPKICPVTGYNQNSQELSRDFQSVGAQCVNHLSNKLALTLFAPSRPFFRLEVSDEAAQQFEAIGMTAQKLAEILSTGERKALKEMDKRALRPKLIEVLKHLLVTGNVLLILDKNKPRVIGIKSYVVKRNTYGEVIELLIKDDVLFDQLDEKVQELTELKHHKADDKVCHYKWLKKDGKDYKLTQWVEKTQLPKEFDGKWPEKKMPYRVLTWDLADNDDYGTGHVEDYIGDLSALSGLSKALIEAGILMAEFRWLLNPASSLSVEDFMNSPNGGVIPGQQGDLSPVQAGVSQVFQQLAPQISVHTSSLGRGFLLTSATTRDAERVTAREISLQANELETSLGGAYSRISVDLQIPLAYFLLEAINFKVDGKDFEPMVVTGLDALSRTSDVDNLLGFLADLAQIQQLNPNANLVGLVSLSEVASAIAAGRGIDSTKIMASEQQIQQVQEQALMAPGPGGQQAQPGMPDQTPI